jgi:ketosteroid isomerase-like protein
MGRCVKYRASFRGEGAHVPTTPQEIFEHYVYLGAITRDAAAMAGLFTPDGIIEAPLVPPGHAYPRRMRGREEIRTGLATYYERTAESARRVNAEESRYVLHTTADPNVFIVEIDTVFDESGEPKGHGERGVVSLVQIFRVRDGKIAMLRDYFAPELVR